MMRGVFPSITATAEFVVPVGSSVSSVTDWQMRIVRARTKIDTDHRALDLLLAAIGLISNERWRQA